VITFLRKGKNPQDEVLIVINFTPVVRENYRVGVSHPGFMKEIFNSDDTKYGGSGVHNSSVESMPIPMHGRERSITLNLPPLGVTYLKYQ
jgi:1,4-alpha-glucan branching enzyme